MPLHPKSPAWDRVNAHFHKLQATSLGQLFSQDPDRFERMSMEAAGVFVDFSKTHANTETWACLDALAEGIPHGFTQLMDGEKLNHTEDRAAWHTALRTPTPPREVQIVLDRMGHWDRQLRTGILNGHTGQPFRRVVNLGIGGSDLGPALVCEALHTFRKHDVDVRFVSNIDPTSLEHALDGADASTTLFIVTSKTFTTLETLANATAARRWVLSALNEPSAIAKHFCAVTSAPDKAHEFGIDPANIFEFWDWVGGRYSLWSAAGLVIVAALGMDRFAELLAGAHSMDEHSETAPIASNLPIRFALNDIWYRNFWGNNTLCLVPYCEALRALPSFFQQLNMESNGKCARRNGEPTHYPTSPIIWGGVGTTAQHAFFQALHQGTQPPLVEFILPLTSTRSHDGRHAHLVANCIAQSEALLLGSIPDESTPWSKHRTMPGNRPSITITLDTLTPRTLGALLAMYEHRVFAQAMLWDINPFDQWGVELGKNMARIVTPELEGLVTHAHDVSTSGLIARYRRLQNKVHQGAA